MVFCEDDGSITSKVKDAYDSGCTKNQWVPSSSGSWNDDDYADNSLDSSDRKDGLSFQRTCGADGMPLDTNTNSDWELAPINLGEGYFVPEEISGTLKVENSPFFPHGDHPDKTLMGNITYTLDSADYIVSLAIYDINGYVKKYLLRDSTIAEAQGGITWNGYDDSGDLVPVGIYIVHLRAEHTQTGRVKNKQASIVVGRKF
jgi:hypothetical protein